MTEYDATAPDKKVITTKTSKPTTVSTTPASAIRGDIDCVLADLSGDDENKKVPFPEFGVDIVFRRGELVPNLTLLHALKAVFHLFKRH